MQIKCLITLLVTSLLISACSDSRQDAFVQAQCGELAPAKEVYEACEKVAIEMYKAINN